MIRACYTLDSLRLPCGDFLPLPISSPLPTWVSLEGFLRSEFPVVTSVASNTVIKNAFRELVSSEYDNYLHVYTDGSLFRSPLSWTAVFVMPSLDFSSSWKFSRSHSIVVAEL